MCWQVENVECMPGDHIKFDFLGKDSIRYENEVVVNPKVYQLIKKFCQQFANKKRKFSLCMCMKPVLFAASQHAAAPCLVD